MRLLFDNLKAAVRENTEQAIKEFWKKFSISDVVAITGNSCGEIEQKMMSKAGKNRVL